MFWKWHQTLVFSCSILTNHARCKICQCISFRPPVTDELMYGQIQQNNLCIDIEIGHVPAIAKLGQCNSDRDSQVCILTHWLCLYIVSQNIDTLAVFVHRQSFFSEDLLWCPHIFCTMAELDSVTLIYGLYCMEKVFCTSNFCTVTYIHTICIRK